MRTSRRPRRATAAALLSLLAILAAGCDGKSPTAPTLPNGNVVPQVLYNATSSGLATSERRVVRSDATLEQLLEEIFSDGTPRPDFDPIDFERYMVLVVASGEQPNACYAIAVTAASGDGIDLTVTVTETAPTASCVCAEVLTQPVEVVRVPRADQVFFVEAEATTCPAS